MYAFFSQIAKDRGNRPYEVMTLRGTEFATQIGTIESLEEMKICLPEYPDMVALGSCIMPDEFEISI
jgi:hypothetical protein